MITFVTAFLDLREDRSKDKSVDRCFQLFDSIQKSGIRLHVFVSPEYRDRIHVTNGVVEVISLEDLDTQKNAPPGIPDHRTSYHDTRNFLILMNSKIEFIRRAMEVGTTSHYAWIDFSIAHVFRNLETLLYLGMLGRTQLRNGLWFPGCWTSPSSSLDQVNWRFCGGFFVGDRESYQPLIQLQSSEFSKLPKLSWEVNVWSYWEAYGRWKPTWFSANHDDSIVRIPSDAMLTVASLTTIPPRLENECRLAVESILPQVDHVYLFIADSYRRFESVAIPEWTQNPKITVVRGEDRGPASKYIGCHSQIPKGSWVFVCDDDQEQAGNLIARMKSNLKQWGVYQNHQKSICQKTSGGIIHGQVGNLVPVEVLHWAAKFPLPDAAFYVDDQWMSAVCFRHSVPIFASGVESQNEIFAVLQGWHEKLGTASLSSLNNRDSKIRELEESLGIRFNGTFISE